MNLERGNCSGLPYAVRPAAAATTTRPPVLCFLHGYDEGPPTELLAAVTRHGPLRSLASRRTANFVVVAPQLPVRGDHWHRYAGAVHDVVEEACERFDADRSHAYLTGFSFGGNGVFDLAAEGRAPWAALWAVDPTRAPRVPLTPPVWLSVGEVTRMGLPRFVRSMQLVQREGPAHGARVYADEGDDHVGAATRAYGDARIYDWLLRWTSAVAR